MRTLFILLLFIFPFFTNAQIAVGARIGLNIPNQKAELNGIETRFQPKSLKVIDVAIPINIALSERLSVQPEFHFLQKGERTETFDTNLVVMTFKNQYNYLEMPLLLKLDFDKGGGKLYAIGGIHFGYLLSGKESVTIGDLSDERPITLNERREPGITRIFDRSDIGLTAGVGMEFPLTSGNIIVDARYSTAFNNMRIEELLNDVLTFKNFGFAVSVGYMHYFGKKKSKKSTMDLYK